MRTALLAVRLLCLLCLLRFPACAICLQTVKEEISVLAELALCVREEEAPELYRLSEEDGVEVGPFTVSAVRVQWSGVGSGVGRT